MTGPSPETGASGQPALVSAVPAGLVDAGAAALATFGIGLVAARLLAPNAFAVYALFFALFTAVMVISTQLAFVPAEVRVIERPVDERLAWLPATLRAGWAPALLGSLVTPVTLLALPHDADRSVVTPLLVTALAAGVVSPVQDHVRRMLHAGGRSWAAAGVSAVQLTVTALGLLVLGLAPVSPGWVPFGALVAANLASAGYGIVAARRSTSPLPQPPDLRLSRLVSSGRWLLAVGLIPNGGAFVAGVLVAHLASAEALGHAEVARVVSRPIPVVAVALASVLGPRLMQAVTLGDRPGARRLERMFLGTLVLAALGYGAWVAVDWVGNPMAAILPSAYIVAGLVPAVVVGVTLNQFAVDLRLELTAGREEKRLARIEGVSGIVRMAAASTAAVTAEFAIPLAYAAMGIVRAVGFRRAAGRHLWSRDPVTPAAAPGSLVP